MTTVTKYRIYCITEGTFVEGWGDPPTKCYNDHSHEINPNSISDVDTISTNYTFIKEETQDLTGGIFKCDTITISIDPNSTKISTLSYPFLIYVMRIFVNPMTENIGDTFSLLYPIETIIGVLTAPLPISTPIPLSSQAISQLKVGLYIDIVEGSDIRILGRIISIDTTNLTITTESLYTETINPGSLIRVCAKYIDNFKITGTNTTIFSNSRINGAYLQPGIEGKLVYINNTNATKSFSICLEYLY